MPSKKQPINAQEFYEAGQNASFVPYACHYDADTLLTQDGELIQIICIRGYQFSTMKDGAKTDLRQDVRRAMFESILHEYFSVSFHVVRHRTDLSLPYRGSSEFGRSLDQEWNRKHSWNNNFSNDLYIAVSHEGTVFPLWDFVQITRSFFLRAEKHFQSVHLKKARDALTEATDSILAQLAHYNPVRLGLTEQNGTFYSEPLKFLNHLLNLEPNQPIPMPVSDLGNVLARYPMEFVYNTLEVHTSIGLRHASIFSVKQYNEIIPKAVDIFLQHPCEFILTQHVMYGAPKKFLKDVEYKKYIAELGDDRDFVRFSGIADILASNQESQFDYSMQQITIMPIANSAGQLEAIVHDLKEKLGKTGIAVVREDIMMEDIFYSQLPGNFEMLRRKEPINTNRTGGYSTLYDFPTGKWHGNHWGPALSVFPSDEKNPYFFSLHSGNEGHTVIAGPYGCGKTILLNFLLTQSQRIQLRTLLIDNQRASEITMRALGGNYSRISRDKSAKAPKMNPFLMQDTPHNRAFLTEWVALLFHDLDGNPPPAPLDYAWIVSHMMELPPEKRRLSELVTMLAGAPAEIRETLTQWTGTGRYGHIFDNDADEWEPGKITLQGIDITEMVQDRKPQWAVLSYLMHRWMLSLNGSPALLILDEAWTLFDNPVFANKIGGWLDRMQERNCVAVMTTEHIEDITQSQITPLVMLKAATRIFFPDANATDAYQTLLGLSEKDYQRFVSIEKSKRQFFFKQKQESVVLELQLPENRVTLEMLKGSPTVVTRMENAIGQVGEDPAKWLPLFTQQL